MNQHYTRQDLENAKFKLETARKLLNTLLKHHDPRLANTRMIKDQERRISDLEGFVKRIATYLNSQGGKK